MKFKPGLIADTWAHQVWPKNWVLIYSPTMPSYRDRRTPSSGAWSDVRYMELDMMMSHDFGWKSL